MRDLGELIEAREARIGVMGLGYVGLPLAVEFAKAGFAVTGFELDAEKVRAISDRRSYIEDVPQAEVARAARRRQAPRHHRLRRARRLRRDQRLRPDAAHEDQGPRHLVHGRRRRGDPASACAPGQLVILGSTTYPGTTHELFLPILEAAGSEGRRGLRARLRARAHRPGQQAVQGAQRAEGGGRRDAALHAARRQGLRAGLRDRRSRSRRRRRPRW